MYQRPDMITPGVDAQGQPIDPRRMQEHFEDFYEDIFEELSRFGEIENLNICDNLADHMIGNVYVQFREEDQAAAAHTALHGRFYSGRPIIVDFSPVTDFREATCRQYEENSCNRGGYCNFMHVKQIGRDLRKNYLAITGSHNRVGAAAQAHVIGGSVMIMITTVDVMITVVVEGGEEAADMKDMMMEEGVGTVVALQGVQGVPPGRAARSAGPRSNSGIMRGTISRGEYLEGRATQSIVRLSCFAVCCSVLSCGNLFCSGTMSNLS